MRVRHALTVSLAFNAGVLFTLACTNGGDAVNAVAETIAAAIRAVDVAFDDTTAQLGSSTAQEAIDALDTRLDALDDSDGGLGARLTAAEAAVAALTAQLEALKDQPKVQPAVDALMAKDAELQKAIDAQLAAIAGHDGQLAALAATSNSMTTCPPETYRVGTTCIEAKARNETFFDAAAKVCAKVGGRLCFPSEFGASCELSQGVTTNGTNEFTAIIAESGPRLANTEFNICMIANDPVQKPEDPGVYPFRCCYDRINLDEPEPPPDTP
jgi:hypothetical protein